MFTMLAIAILSFVIALSAAEDAVTCGSVVKLQHRETGYHLHSHPIAWGSGSAQQSVTAQSSASDQGDFWLVKSASRNNFCQAGVAVRCGDMVRLEHTSTGKNLHSHLFKAAITGNQEVSCFGDGGNGDTGDDWTVECTGKDEYWLRGKAVTFKHADTGKYLFTSMAAQFNQQNCGMQCPIMGQTECSAANRKDSKTSWVTTQGVYFKNASDDDHDRDDEL